MTAVQYDWRGPEDFKSYSIRRTHPPKRPATATGGEQYAPGFDSDRRPNQRRCTRRPFSPPEPDPALRKRREVYQNALYSMHVGSNPYSGYRDVLPAMVSSDAELQSKARTWIRRELRVFTFLHTDPVGLIPRAATTSSNAEFLLSYVVSILKTVDIRADHGHAENLLTDFLGRDTANLFLHELNAWLRSPYTRLKDWDDEVQYQNS